MIKSPCQAIHNWKTATLSACLGLLLFISPVLQAELPNIGDTASQVITPDEEYRLGKKLLGELRGALPLVEDLELNIYLNNLGYDLVSSSQDIEFPYTFILVDDDTINAFAMPGGIIGVNRGLIETTETEAELAAVIAHEIAHVTQRHLARFYQESKGVNLKTALGILAAAVIGSYSSQGGQAALLGTLAMNADSQLRFTRANEIDADRVGYQILEQAGYDTTAMQTIFNRLQKASLSDPDRVSEFLQTHPLPSSRISDSIRLEQPSQTGKKQDSINFRLARARLTGISTPLPELITLARNSAANTPEAQYLVAISNLRHNQHEAALEILRSIKLGQADGLAIKLQEIRTLLAAKKYSKAIELARLLHRDHPRNPAVVGMLGEAYLMSDDPLAALDLLKQTRVSLEQWPTLLKLKADAAQKSGFQGQSHEALAEYYYYRGDIALTLEQVKLALKSPFFPIAFFIIPL